MKKLIILGIFVQMIVFSFTSYAANGNRYIGKDIPTDDQISRMYALLFRGRCQIAEIIGKQQISDNVYNVFYFFSCSANGLMDPESNGLDSLALIKLDTEVWIMKQEQVIGVVLE